jgi:transposase
MPQALLPIFPAEATSINNVVSFARRDGVVYYFHGCQPVFSHAEHDLKSFRMFTSQLAVNGTCKQAEIVRAFGISAISMKRYVKKYRKGGVTAFYGQRRKPQPRVLTGEVLKQAQELFEQGESRAAVAQKLDLKPDTLRKAVKAGRLVEPVKKTNRGARTASVV